MTGGRDYDEDVAYWRGFDNGEETDASDDRMLEHLTDDEIVSLIDSYDDGRISTLAFAYIHLRQQLKDLARIAAEGVSRADVDTVKTVLLDFDWHNYRLDEVGLAEADDWAKALARAVITKIGGLHGQREGNSK